MRKLKYIGITIIILSFIYFLSSDSLMNKMAEALVHKGPIESAEAIVVLSGSGTGNRIKAGVKLFKKGLGKVIIVSGDKVYHDYYTHNLMKELAVKLGVPKDKIITEKIVGETSTWGEGISNLRILKKNKIESFILVTSAFHTYRAHMIYKALISEFSHDFKWFVYPAIDPFVPIHGWWNIRIARIAIFMEYLKILNFYIEH